MGPGIAAQFPMLFAITAAESAERGLDYCVNNAAGGAALYWAYVQNRLGAIA